VNRPRIARSPSRATAALRAAALTCVLTLAVVLVGGVSQADAAPKGIVGVFGGVGSGNGQFQKAGGVAVNQTTGDVYVVDIGNARVQRFDADGDFLSQFGSAGSGDGQFGVDPGGTQLDQIAGIAVAPDGSVYVADPINSRVQRFEPDGDYVSQFGSFGSGNGQFSRPTGVAVDPADGDVLVADRDNHRVQRFSSTGVYQSQFDGLDADPIVFPVRVDVDVSGAIYVVEGASWRIQKFDSAGGNPVPFAPGVLTNAKELAIDRDNGDGLDHLLVAQFNAAFDGLDVLELDPDGVLIETHEVPLFQPSGLAVRSSTDRIYVAHGGNNRVYILGETTPPVATVEPVTDNDGHGVTLRGAVDPNGGATTRYRFEYSGDDGATWTPVPATDVAVGDGDDEVSVSQRLEGLEANKEYRLRLVATKDFDTGTDTDETTFQTIALPPEVTTVPVTQRTSTGATLPGGINANNLPTTYHFEYTTEADFDANGWANATHVPDPEATIPASGTQDAVAETVAGLVPDASYRYRLVATSTFGGGTTVEGPARAFRTLPADLPASTRAYELVSPAYKVGGIGVGRTYRGIGDLATSGYASYDAREHERFLTGGDWGSTLLDEGMSTANSWAAAERAGDQGWIHHAPAAHPIQDSQQTRFANVADGADDLSRIGWFANGGYAVFPEMVAAGVATDAIPNYFGDWSGKWELLGPNHASQINGLGSQELQEMASDGSQTVVWGSFHGLGGPTDPTRPSWPDRVDGRSVHLADSSAAPAGSFAGTGARALVNGCSGEGPSRTRLPARTVDGKLADRICPDPLPGRDARLISDRGAAVSIDTAAGGGRTDPVRNAASTNGRRVFFMSPDPVEVGAATCTGATGDATFCPAQLYVRETAADGTATVRWISRPVESLLGAQDVDLLGPAVFEGATPDGDKVFFRTTSPLTPDDPNGNCGNPCQSDPDSGADPASWDLYRYDFPDDPDADPAAGALVRVSAGPGGAGDCNNPQPSPFNAVPRAAALRFASDDGSRAYFACAAPLPGVAGRETGTPAGTPGGATTTTSTTNLYLYEDDGGAGQWTFVARIPRSTAPSAIGQCASTGGHLAQPLYDPNAESDISMYNTTPSRSNCVRGSSDGSLVTFWTDGRLIADDPGGAPTADVYAYRADTDELIRVSAPQGGSGGSYPCGTTGVAAGYLCNADGGFDSLSDHGIVPMPLLGIADDPEAPGERVALFQSRSRLVAGDVNDVYDVYMWRTRNGGELSLVSTGAAGAEHAIYKGNDREGRNVFFVTRESLTWQDADAVADVYTARVGGGVPEPEPPVLCAPLAGACHGPGAPPTGATPKTGAPGGGNAVPSRRRSLALRGLTPAQRRSAARTGVLKLHVRISQPGVVSVVAKARIGKRMRRLGAASKQLADAGPATLRIRLGRPARARLAKRRPLKLRVQARTPGARTRAITVLLRRAGR
jgi:hypothetical protein